MEWRRFVTNLSNDPRTILRLTTSATITNEEKTIINDKQTNTSKPSSTKHNINTCKLYLRPEDACLPFLDLTEKWFLASSPAGTRPSYSHNHATAG